MRRNRRWIIGASVLVLIAAALAATWLVQRPERNPINEAAFVRIRAGMTDREVEEVFRNMPGYRDDGSQFFRRSLAQVKPYIIRRIEWVSPRLEIAVDMDDSGWVTKAYMVHGEPLPNQS